MAQRDGTGFGRFAALLLLAAVVLFLLGWWPSRVFGGADGVASLVVAIAIALVGGLVGRVVQQLVWRLDPTPGGGAQAMLAGLGARLLVSLVLAVVVVFAEPFALVPFALQAALAYGLFLCLEVFVNVRELGQDQRPFGEGSDEADGATHPTGPASE